MPDTWPDLSHPQAAETLETLQLWSQIVGKIRVAQTPWCNHSWHVPLYVNANGLDTGLIPHGDSAFSLAFDLRHHHLEITPVDGEARVLALVEEPIADFHGKLVDVLQSLGLPVDFHGRPNEMADATPFHEDRRPRLYAKDYAERLWRALVRSHLVLSRFRTAFLGKTSPVHFFWGAMDLAVTRFSGRTAPSHPGGLPNLPDTITREAYSHEVSSAGFWPGSKEAPPMFYSYAYPEPPGFAERAVQPEGATWHTELKEFVLPYEVVRSADDGDAALMAFLQSTYDAAADTGNWARQELDCAIGEPRKPRTPHG